MIFVHTNQHRAFRYHATLFQPIHPPLELNPEFLYRLCGKWAVGHKKIDEKNHWMVNDLSDVDTDWSFITPKRNSFEWEISFPFLILYASGGKIEFYNIQTGKCVMTSEDLPNAKYNTFQNGQLFGMSSDRKTIIKLDFNLWKQ